MHYKILNTLAIIGLSISMSAQQPIEEDQSITYANTITVDDLKEHLQILASDALEGRETGKRGQKMAAAYISSEFQTLGLTKSINNSYYQPFNLYNTEVAQGVIKVGESSFECNKDFFFMGSPSSIKTQSSLVFLGNGNKQDLGPGALSGKSVLIINNDRIEQSKAVAKAQSHGAANIFLLFAQSDQEYEERVMQFGSRMIQDRLSDQDPRDGEKRANMFYVSPKLIRALTGKTVKELVVLADNNKKLESLKSSTFEIDVEQLVKIVETENILGYIEGSDLKDEVIVVSCHYDHIGIIDGQVNNGADDDGSGITAILELAQAFSKAKAAGNGPRRTILFLAVTAEEKGLLGSAYYADKAPLFPLENTVANLNIDMLGRIDAKHAGNDNYVYLVGTDKLSTDLHNISETANNTYTKLDLDYAYNDENHPERIYYRSDHWNFAKNNIPVIFYICGFTEDYHKPTDTIEKIEFKALQKRTQLVFYTAWELANRDERLLLNNKE